MAVGSSHDYAEDNDATQAASDLPYKSQKDRQPSRMTSQLVDVVSTSEEAKSNSPPPAGSKAIGHYRNTMMAGQGTSLLSDYVNT